VCLGKCCLGCSIANVGWAAVAVRPGVVCVYYFVMVELSAWVVVRKAEYVNDRRGGRECSFFSAEGA